MSKIKAGDIIESEHGNQYIVIINNQYKMEGTIIHIADKSKAAQGENSQLNEKREWKVIGKVTELEKVIYGIES